MPYILHHNEMLYDEENGKWYSSAEVKDMLTAIKLYKDELPKIRTSLSKLRDQEKSRAREVSKLQAENETLADGLARARSELDALEAEKLRGHPGGE